jgi:hypothetical protein
LETKPLGHGGDTRVELGIAEIAVKKDCAVVMPVRNALAHFLRGLSDQRTRLRGVVRRHLTARHLIQPAHAHHLVGRADIGQARNDLGARFVK